MPKPVSLIIAARNGTNYLAEAVAGISRQEVRVEVIVVDDGSTDSTAKLAASLGCTVHSIPPSGQPRAKNIGLGLAKGEFVLFHDHDDVLRPGALARLLATLKDDTSLAGVMAQAKDFVSPELDSAQASALAPRDEPYFGFLGATLFRRRIFDFSGVFAEDHLASDAVDMLARIQAAGLTLCRMPFIAMDRRLHLSNVGRTRGKIMQFKGYAASLRQLRERERERERKTRLRVRPDGGRVGIAA